MNTVYFCRFVFFFFLGSLLFGCASQPASEATSPQKIIFNPTSDLGNCKYLGIVESTAGENWQMHLRKAAGLKGATHLMTSGPNNVTGDADGETVSASAYFCKNTQKNESH